MNSRCVPKQSELYNRRLAAEGAGRPAERCLPHGLPLDMMFQGSPIRIVQTPSLVVMLLEIANHFRQIPTQRRQLIEDFQPAWYGYSTGQWEGDEFVVETVGFNDETWLDNRGLPHSDGLKLTERFKRVNAGRMDLALTIDDPKYLHPAVDHRHQLRPHTGYRPVRGHVRRTTSGLRVRRLIGRDRAFADGRTTLAVDC